MSVLLDTITQLLSLLPNSSGLELELLYHDGSEELFP